MNDHNAKFTRLDRKNQALLPLLLVILLVFLIQLWLLTIALEEFLAARSALAIPTFAASGACFALNFWLLRYLRAIDENRDDE